MDIKMNIAEAELKAQSLSKDPELIKDLAEKAFAKAFRFESQLKGIKSEFDLIVRLMKAWGAGRYKEISWSSVLIITGAVIYFVNPFDAVPDFLPFFGLSDDLSVFSLALSRVKGELNAYRAWEGRLDSPD